MTHSLIVQILIKCPLCTRGRGHNGDFPLKIRDIFMSLFPQFPLILNDGKIQVRVCFIKESPKFMSVCRMGVQMGWGKADALNTSSVLGQCIWHFASIF